MNVSPSPTGGQLLTVPEAAKRLSVSRATVYRLIGSGDLSITRVRGVARIAEAQIDDYIARHTYHVPKRRKAA